MCYQKGLVSVVIPTHNRHDLIQRAVESALYQTFQQIEVIVVSDGSTDDTASVVNKICDIDKRVSFIEYFPGKGGNHARNTGIKAAKGEWVAFLDDDDKWHETKLEKQMKIARQDENIGLVCTGILAIFDSDGSTSIYIPDTPYDASKTILLGNSIGSTTTVMMKHELLDACGMFDEELMAKQDFDLWIRACQLTKVGVVKEPCVDYHNLVSNNQVSWNYKKYADATEYLNKKYEALYTEKLSSKELSRVYSNNMFSIARKAIKSGNSKIARIYLRKSLNYKFRFIVFMSWFASFLPISMINKMYFALNKK